jgi:hypothetical protein
MNRRAPQDPPGIQPADGDLLINEPTNDEILKAIKQLKSGKAAGPDSIPADTLKADIKTMVKVFHLLFKKIWREEQVLTEWKEGYLIKLAKKGDLRQLCELQWNHYCL